MLALFAREVLEDLHNVNDRAHLISAIKRLSGFVGNRREGFRAFLTLMGLELSEDLSERILSAVSSSGVAHAQFIEHLELAHHNMTMVDHADFERTSDSSLTSASLLSSRAGSGSARIQGTAVGRVSASSSEVARDAAVASVLDYGDGATS
jgi:hypothetical protein